MDLELKKMNKVVAFDFDDTLAMTDSLIGISTLLPINLVDVMTAAGIAHKKVTGKYLWIDSCNYERLESLGIASRLQVVFDYCQTLSVNVESAKPIFSMIQTMQAALAEPLTKVVIITARAGYSSIWSESLQTKVASTNREGILSFLRIHDVEIHDDDLYTVGDVAESGGDTATAKAEVLAKYAKMYPTEEIVFYDDSKRNINAALSLPVAYGIKNPVTVHMIKHGKVIVTERVSHKIRIKQRLDSIFKCIME